MIVPVKESLDHILVRRQRRLHALVRVLSPGVRFGLRLPLEKPRRDVPLKVDLLAVVARGRQLVLRGKKCPFLGDALTFVPSLSGQMIVFL